MKVSTVKTIGNNLSLNVSIPKDTKNRVYTIVPNDIENRHFKEILKWKDLGNTVEPEFSIEEIDKQLADSEQNWAKQELAMSDIELNKVQDGDGKGLVSDWRTHRKNLRIYINSKDFKKDIRPVFTQS